MKKFPILLVEDDENDVFFLQKAFQEAEIRNPLHVAHDGLEAIEYLEGTGRFADRARFPLPGLIVLDLKMPCKGGMDVLQWRRQHTPWQCIPVIVFSSSAQRNDIDNAYRLGANSFVVKPASLEERAELARCIKAFWLRFNEPPESCAPS